LLKKCRFIFKLKKEKNLNFLNETMENELKKKTRRKFEKEGSAFYA